MRCFPFIFDPTDGTPGKSATRYWKFHESANNPDLADIQANLELLAENAYAQAIGVLVDGEQGTQSADELVAQIAKWRRSPFDPHLIARMRPVAYQKAVVMKYLDNILAWADALF